MDNDKYIPTEEERRKFGRVSRGYSQTSNYPTFNSQKSKFDTRKVLNLLTHITPKLSSDQSRKKFQKFWFDCLQFSKDDVIGCIKYIRGHLNQFNSKDNDLILDALKQIEERYNNAI